MGNGIKVLIVDDELHNRIVLETMLLQNVPVVSEIFQAGTVNEAITCINIHQPAIVFLDIQLNNETGFDLLQQIPEFEFEVIFITAHENYAIKAFRFHAVDYLLKPLLVQELKDAVNKALLPRSKTGNNFNEKIFNAYNQIHGSDGLNESLTITTNEGFIVILLSNIVYCHAKSNYTIVYLNNKTKITSSKTLGYFEDLLQNKNFFRAHRSYLINLLHVDSYKRGEGGTIKMSNGDEVELARNNKGHFMQLFKV